MEKKKSTFSGSFGFIMAAAASAVGLGNLWRFPNLAAKNGGGLFLIMYLILALTFGFTLLTTELAIGRKLKQHPLRAYGTIGKKWNFMGVLTFIVPVLISTYYSVVGGWILKYLVVYSNESALEAASKGYFTDFTHSYVSPICFMLLFMGISAFIVYCGVEKGIEKFSKVVMPILLVMILGIAVFTLTLSYTDASGDTRTGLDGLWVYIIPNFEGLTFSRFLEILMDAMGQLFYSLSVAMGIMITYGAYVKDDVNLGKSINRIELFDTLVAFLAGLMVVPAVVIFQGADVMQESAGAGLMFVQLPKVFQQMPGGTFIAVLFFILVAFAALTSNVSILETIVASISEKFDKPRKKITLFVALVSTIGAVVICLGYNVFFFEVDLPNGATDQQLLDVVDYIANNLIMPIIALITCIIIGWVVKPKWVIEEVEKGGHKFRRKGLYTVMVKFIAPIFLILLFLKAIGVYDLIANAIMG